jgi:Fur family zinc uptake transcriptional regulator
MVALDYTCHHPHGLAGSALESAIRMAGQTCAARGEKLTDSRRRALELVLQADGPIKAYDIMAVFGPAPAKPPTVYRALEFLVRAGLVHRIESLNAYVPCRGHGTHTAAFLICDGCGHVEEQMLPAPPTPHFTPNRWVIEAHGQCAGCRQTPNA